MEDVPSQMIKFEDGFPCGMWLSSLIDSEAA